MQDRDEPVGITHDTRNTQDFWSEMQVSRDARQKLLRTTEVISGMIDRAVAQNPNLYPDDYQHGIFPRLGQRPDFHQHDVLTHIVAVEEALRSGEAAEEFSEGVRPELKRRLMVRPSDDSLTYYELALIAGRMHDVGKLLEDRRPFDLKDPFAGQDKKRPKEPIAGLPFAGKSHFEIGRTIISQKLMGILTSEEVKVVTGALNVHQRIQKEIEKIIDGREGVPEAVREIERNTGADKVLIGTLVAMADSLGKGEPKQESEQSKTQKQVTKNLCLVMISRVLERTEG